MAAVVSSGGGSFSGDGEGNGNPPFAVSCIGFIHGCRCYRCAFRRVREKEIEIRKCFHEKVYQNIFVNRNGERMFDAEKLLTFEEFNEVLDEQSRLMKTIVIKMHQRAQDAVGGVVVEYKSGNLEMHLGMILSMASLVLSEIGSGELKEDPAILE